MDNTRILIVEDEILVAREIEHHLHTLGYTVVGITIRAGVVVQQVSEMLPDLVLMDINLQGKQDGILMAREIHDRFQIPVIYITAYDDDDTLKMVKATHPFGYILKPFNQRGLRVAVELALSRRQREAQETPEQLLIASQTNFQSGGLPPNKLKKTLRYIENHLNQELNLEKVANEVGMTTDYFARLFKQSTGTSVHQYIIHQRVKQAQKLLRESELAIAEIAIECGFANSSHLALHFKRIVGIAPKQFRRF